MYLSKKIQGLLLAPLLYSIHLFAQDYTVSSGSAKSKVSGNQHTIETSPNAVLHWKDFSIAAKEHLHFAQKNAASSVLNRVTGDQLSQILGSLTSNGKVYLFNPNGIFIGKDACIHTAGFLASTANFSNEDFFKGQQLYLDAFSDAKITNQGKISCAEGDIFLIAKQVLNEGECSADYIGAGPAFKVVIQPSREQRFFIQPDMGEVLNTGTLQALAVELRSSSAYEKAIRTEGNIAAENILLSAENGGVSIDGHINAPQGDVKILGKDIFVGSATHIDVSSDTGGQIYIGGGQGGKDPALFNAITVKVESGALISADGLQGDAGKVIIWSDDTTEMYGHVSAHGAKAGGFVEVSGKRTLSLDDTPDVRSDSGNNGTLLLDPGSVTIINGVNTPPTVNGTFTDGYINNFLTTTGNLTISTAVDSADGAAEVLTVTGTANINWATANNLTLIGNQNLIVNSGAIINASAGGGSINLQGNPLGTFTGTVAGISITGATIASSSGSITFTGIGGTITSDNGIEVLGTTTITSTSGPIIMYGLAAGTSGNNSNIGVSISSTGTITSSTGNILLVGTSTTTGTGFGNAGFFSGGIIQTLTSGTITIIGQGDSATGTANSGVSLQGVISGAGTISITGTAGTSGTVTTGVLLSNGTITASAANSIFLMGQAAGTGVASSSSQITASSGSITLMGMSSSQNLCHGVAISGTTNAITSTSGPISLYGSSNNGTGGLNSGVFVANGSITSDTGNIVLVGTISITGTVSTNANGINFQNGNIRTLSNGPISLMGFANGSGSSLVQGVAMGSVTTNPVITTATGTITLNGRSDAGGVTTISSMNGLAIAGTITATGAGTILMYGLSGTIAGGSWGVTLSSSITSNGGDIVIVGTSRGSVSASMGATSSNGSFILTTGTGSITFIGIGGAGIISPALQPRGLITTASGNMLFQGIANGSAGSPGVLFLSGTVLTASGNVNIIGQASGGGLSPSQGILLQASSISASTTGNINMNGSTTGFSASCHGIDLRSSLTTNSGNITLSGMSGVAGTATGILTDSTITISSTSGTITLFGTARGTLTQSNGIKINGTVVAAGSGSIFLTGVGSGTTSGNGILIVGSVTTASGSITCTGTSQGSIDSNTGITLTSGGFVRSATGAGMITLNGFGAPGSGTSNYGVLISGTSSSITTQTGAVNIAGTTNSTGTFSNGIQLSSGGTITSIGSGSITLNGVGGKGGTCNGIVLPIGLGVSSTSSGNISITGSSQSLSSGIGVSIPTGAQVDSSGTGSIFLAGVGSGTTSGNGILIVGSVTTVSGSITCTGTSQGSIDSNTGITLTSGGFVRSATGAGMITLNGFGAAGSDTGNYGVLISGTSSSITTQTGAVNIAGTTNSTGTFSNGIQLSSGGTITSIGSGSITLNGVGGKGGTCNGIVLPIGLGVSSTSSGNISITGSSQSLSSGIGVSIPTGAQVDSSGTGSIFLAGVGSGTTSGNGILIVGSVTTVSGSITCTGTSQGSIDSNTGITLTSGGFVRSATGAGMITLNGFGAAGSDTGNYGVLISGTSSSITTQTGAVNIAGTTNSTGTFSNGIQLSSGGTITSIGSGSITLNGVGGKGGTCNGIVLPIGLGVSSTSSGNISITGSSQSLSSGIGVSIPTGAQVDSSSTGSIFLTGVGSGTTSGNGILIVGSVTTASGSITCTGTSQGSIDSNTGITLTSGGFVRSSTGAGMITLNGFGAAGSDTGNYGVLISGTSSSITTQTGAVNIAGTTNSTGTFSNGIQLSSGGTITSIGSGSITLNGVGGMGDTCNGIVLPIGLGISSTSSGNISITGSSQGLSSGIGVSIPTGAQLNSSGTGSVSITGMGSSLGTTLNDGIFISGTGALVTSASGNITLTGTGNGSGNTNRGVAITSGGSVTSTSGAAITAQGTGGSTGPNSWGILIDASGLTATTGAISLTGISSGATEEGILIDHAGLVQANNSTLVSLTTLSDLIIQNGSSVNLLGTTPLSINSSRDLSILGGAGVPAFISIENGNGTLVVGRDLNVVSGTGAGSEAQIGNHGGLVASASGALTFTSIGRNVNVTATDPGAFALIGHGTPATVQTLSGNILFTDVVNDMTLTGAPAGAGSFGFAQIGHVNATAGGSTLSGDITATCGNNINILGGSGAVSAYAQIGHGGQAGAATYGAATLSLFAGVDCTLLSSTGNAIVANQGGDLTIVVDNLNPTSPAIGPGAFSFSSTLTATGNLKIYTATRSQNNVPSGTVINGAVYIPGFADSSTEQWNIYYPGGTYTPGSPFKIYYKDTVPPPPPPPPSPVPPPPPPAPVPPPPPAPIPTPSPTPFIPTGLPIANLGSLADTMDAFAMHLLQMKCRNSFKEGNCQFPPFLISSEKEIE